MNRSRAADLYELLEVSPGASQEVIQAAYKVLARTWHPDVNDSPDASRRIRELNGAYHVLSDTHRRATYDLQRARLRRRERLIDIGDLGESRPSSPIPISRDSSRQRALAARRAAAATSATERLSVRSGHTMIAILAALAALLTVIVLVLWVGMAISEDGPADTSAMFVQLHDKTPIPDPFGN